MSSFIHLHVHSEYSLADGVARIKPTIAQAKAFGMPALAIADLNNIYAAVKFYQSCVSAGVKPIIGAEVWVENPVEPRQYDKLLLLAQNNTGYTHLCEILSEAVIHNQHQGKPVVGWQYLQERADGLLAMMHPQNGRLSHLIQKTELGEASKILAKYQTLFPGRLYLEISRVGSPGEDAYIANCVTLASTTVLPLVAVNQVQFVNQADFRSHEVRVCINDGRQLGDPRRVKRFTDQQYLKSPEEMTALFADLPDAVTNTLEIAKRCNVFFTFGVNYLPKFPGSGEQTAEQAIAAISESGLAERLGVPSLYDSAGEPLVDTAYTERLNLEIGVINQMGFPGYFLIVADFIRWSREHGIPVGPGRGSGAGSVVAWAMGITDLDPLEYGLLFERFLNPERVSMPDFDIDFCMEGRDRVIAYVADCYGRDQVSQIITFGSMAAKAAIRDVGRVMGYSYGYVDSIARLIPFQVGITLDKALAEEEDFRARYEEDNEAAELIDAAREIEGIARNVGKHAGGVVIAPSQLTDFTALFAESESAQAVSQLDKDDLEAIGLVKFDFLGLRTLTVIDWAEKLINQRREGQGEEPIKAPVKAFFDQKTFELIQAGKTHAVFQLESRGMRELVIKLQPDCFEDLIALVALYRPGPLESGMVDDFVERKHGRQQVRFPHPDTEAILKETYGVILYQEQVMQIAQVLAGYSLGSADLLRRAMGKKKPEEMAKQRQDFMQGSGEKDIDASDAEYIFDLMEKFAGYGFNKSHSAAYALISFQTAWLKAHYPAAFMAATLSADMDHTDKIVGIIAECRSLGLEVVTPNINTGMYRFQPIEDDTILYGLGAVKGVGETAIESIVSEREQGGDYKSVHDLCDRVDHKQVNKRALESLVRSGACDCFGDHRAQLLSDLPYALEVAAQKAKDHSAGQVDLFGIDVAISQPSQARTPVESWPDLRQLHEERVALGLYLSGHPYDSYRAELAELVGGNLVAGMIVANRVINTRGGGKMAFVTLDNGESRVEVSVFSRLFEVARDCLRKDSILIAQGELKQDEREGGGIELAADSLCDINMLREDKLVHLRIKLHQTDADAIAQIELIRRLSQVLKPYQGGSVFVVIEHRNADGVVGQIHLGDAWRVNVNQMLVDELQKLLGSEQALYWDYRLTHGGDRLRFQADRPKFNFRKGQAANRAA